MNLLLDQTITAEEFEAHPDTGGLELVDGKLVEMNVSAVASYIGGNVYFLLRQFSRANAVGWVFPQETMFQCFPGRPNTVRKPDTAVVRLGKFPGEELPEGNIRVAPDLAVEVVSPNDEYYAVERKVAEYRSAGVSLIWVICPPTRTVLIRRGDGSAGEVGEAGELDGEGVVPGFRCRVSDLFEPTTGAAPAR